MKQDTPLKREIKPETLTASCPECLQDFQFLKNYPPPRTCGDFNCMYNHYFKLKAKEERESKKL